MPEASPMRIAAFLLLLTLPSASALIPTLPWEGEGTWRVEPTACAASGPVSFEPQDGLLAGAAAIQLGPACGPGALVVPARAQGRSYEFTSPFSGSFVYEEWCDCATLALRGPGVAVDAFFPESPPILI